MSARSPASSSFARVGYRPNRWGLSPTPTAGRPSQDSMCRVFQGCLPRPCCSHHFPKRYPSPFARLARRILIKSTAVEAGYTAHERRPQCHSQLQQQWRVDSCTDRYPRRCRAGLVHFVLIEATSFPNRGFPRHSHSCGEDAKDAKDAKDTKDTRDMTSRDTQSHLVFAP